jgi:serine/threonine protein kinase
VFEELSPCGPGLTCTDAEQLVSLAKQYGKTEVVTPWREFNGQWDIARRSGALKDGPAEIDWRAVSPRDVETFTLIYNGVLPPSGAKMNAEGAARLRFLMGLFDAGGIVANWLNINDSCDTKRRNPALKDKAQLTVWDEVSAENSNRFCRIIDKRFQPGEINDEDWVQIRLLGKACGLVGEVIAAFELNDAYASMKMEPVLENQMFVFFGRSIEGWVVILFFGIISGETQPGDVRVCGGAKTRSKLERLEEDYGSGNKVTVWLHEYDRLSVELKDRFLKGEGMGIDELTFDKVARVLDQFEDSGGAGIDKEDKGKVIAVLINPVITALSESRSAEKAWKILELIDVEGRANFEEQGRLLKVLPRANAIPVEKRLKVFIATVNRVGERCLKLVVGLVEAVTASKERAMDGLVDEIKEAEPLRRIVMRYDEVQRETRRSMAEHIEWAKTPGSQLIEDETPQVTGAVLSEAKRGESILLTSIQNTVVTVFPRPKDETSLLRLRMKLEGSPRVRVWQSGVCTADEKPSIEFELLNGERYVVTGYRIRTGLLEDGAWRKVMSIWRLEVRVGETWIVLDSQSLTLPTVASGEERCVPIRWGLPVNAIRLVCVENNRGEHQLALEDFLVYGRVLKAGETTRSPYWASLTDAVKLLAATTEPVVKECFGPKVYDEDKVDSRVKLSLEPCKDAFVARITKLAEEIKVPEEKLVAILEPIWNRIVLFHARLCPEVERLQIARGISRNVNEMFIARNDLYLHPQVGNSHSGFGPVRMVSILNVADYFAAKYYTYSGGSEARLDDLKYLACVLSKLTHPFLAPVVRLCAMEPGHGPVVVTRFYKGRSLGDRIRELTEIDMTTRTLIVVEVVSAVSYLHSRSVVHENLRPSKILLSLDESGNIQDAYVTGTATNMMVRRGLLNFEKIGDTEYTGPECFASDWSKRGHDHRSKADVYAVGRIALDLLAPRVAVLAYYAQSVPVWCMLFAEFCGMPEKVPSAVEDTAEADAPAAEKKARNLYDKYGKFLCEKRPLGLADFGAEVVGMHRETLRILIKCTAADPDIRPMMADVELAFKKIDFKLCVGPNGSKVFDRMWELGLTELNVGEVNFEYIDFIRRGEYETAVEERLLAESEASAVESQATVPVSAAQTLEDLVKSLKPGDLRAQLSGREPLGIGGYGTSYLFEGQLPAKTVSLVAKFYDKTTQDNLATNFAESVGFYRDIESPYIAKNLRITAPTQDSGIVVITPLYEGSSLDVFFNDAGLVSQMTPTQAVLMVCGIVKGLEKIHGALPSMRLCHGDLKPSNILLFSDRFTPCVTDCMKYVFGCFGLVPMSRGDGPKEHQAPEVATFDGKDFRYDKYEDCIAPVQRADIYSLGLILCEILNRVPRENLGDGLSAESLREMQPSALVAHLIARGVVPAFAELLGRCLSEEPAERPTAAEIVNAIKSAGYVIAVGADGDEVEQGLQY